MRVLAYAQTVVDLETGTAHRPSSYQAESGRRTYWDSDNHCMTEEPVMALMPTPACQEQPEHPDRLAEWSAGWANHLGYDGCPACWPGEETS